MSETAKPTEPPLLGRWHHGSGTLVCGTIRIADESFDTDPCDEFKQEVFAWMCGVLNDAVEAFRAGGQSSQQLAERINALEGQRDRLVDGIKLAMRHVPHTAECCVVRPTEQWDGNGSVSFEGCNCDRRKLESILECTEGQAEASVQ